MGIDDNDTNPDELADLILAEGHQAKALGNLELAKELDDQGCSNAADACVALAGVHATLAVYERLGDLQAQLAELGANVAALEAGR